MSWLLKIVQGPNAGAEIALPEGVAVSLGKTDACDIILADPTLPEEPLALEAGSDGVSAGGEALEAFLVKTLGSTSFAVGPAEGAWGKLVWPEPAKDAKDAEAGGKSEDAAEPNGVKSESGEQSPAAQKPAGKESKGKERRRSSLGCGCLAILILILLLAAACWFFRDTVKPYAAAGWDKAKSSWRAFTRTDAKDEAKEKTPSERLEELAKRYGLAATTNAHGETTLSGDFKTRRDRLEATAAAYSVLPGVALDFADDESLRSAVEDTLFTIGGNALKVAAATNRVVALSGAAPSASSLRKILEAMNADLPKLRGVDCAAVKLGGPGSDGKAPDQTAPDMTGPAAPAVAATAVKKAAATPPLPVCGILATPYPCLVMRNGARILEGATIGGSTILKIEPDAVTITNATGRFVWKP